MHVTAIRLVVEHIRVVSDAQRTNLGSRPRIGTHRRVAFAQLLGDRAGRLRKGRQDQEVWRWPRIAHTGTSGAAEIFAAALAGNKRADLIGEHTIGRAASQKLVKLPDGTGLWLSTSALPHARRALRCTKRGRADGRGRRSRRRVRPARRRDQSRKTLERFGEKAARTASPRRKPTAFCYTEGSSNVYFAM